MNINKFVHDDKTHSVGMTVISQSPHGNLSDWGRTTTRVCDECAELRPDVHDINQLAITLSVTNDASHIEMLI